MSEQARAEMHTRAKRFMENLLGNVSDWHAGLIDFKTFGARQRETWDSIREAGSLIENLVLFGVREQLPPKKPA